jgi:hypothetical protein
MDIEYKLKLQWSKEKGRKDNQLSTKYYIKKLMIEQYDPHMKPGVELRCSERVNRSCTSIILKESN